MNCVQKKIMSCLLLCVVAAPLLFSLVFLTRQYCIRHEMDNDSENESLVCLQLPVSSLHWLREGKELRVNEKMMDVQSMVIVGTMATIKGRFDTNEEKLIAGFSNIYKENAGPFSLNHDFFKFLFLPYFKYSQSPFESSIYPAMPEINKFFIASCIRSVPLDITSPPPRQL